MVTDEEGGVEAGSSAPFHPHGPDVKMALVSVECLLARCSRQLRDKNDRTVAEQWLGGEAISSLVSVSANPASV